MSLLYVICLVVAVYVVVMLIVGLIVWIGVQRQQNGSD